MFMVLRIKCIGQNSQKYLKNSQKASEIEEINGNLYQIIFLSSVRKVNTGGAIAE